MCEFFETLLSGKKENRRFDGLIAKLEKMQDGLGALQDEVTFAKLVADVMGEAEAKRPAGHAGRSRGGAAQGGKGISRDRKSQALLAKVVARLKGQLGIEIPAGHLRGPYSGFRPFRLSPYQDFYTWPPWPSNRILGAFCSTFPARSKLDPLCAFRLIAYRDRPVPDVSPGNGAGENALR